MEKSSFSVLNRPRFSAFLTFFPYILKSLLLADFSSISQHTGWFSMIHWNPVILNPNKQNSLLYWIFSPEKVSFYEYIFPDKANPAFNEFSASTKWFDITDLMCNGQIVALRKTSIKMCINVHYFTPCGWCVHRCWLLRRDFRSSNGISQSPSWRKKAAYSLYCHELAKRGYVDIWKDQEHTYAMQNKNIHPHACVLWLGISSRLTNIFSFIHL